ncbi:MAG: hypothetical protein ACTTJK_01720 [Phocaeicola sp.]|uniref:hypothetical protein n=1 Tax=Phocaeicola sp. TaxID=2773926 RepID=UPI003F9F51C7
MKRYNLLLLILISFTSFQIKAQNIVISGFVLEKSSHSPLIGANVYSDSEQYGSITDKNKAAPKSFWNSLSYQSL